MTYFAKSDIGRKREKNEDFYAVKKFDENLTVFVIADGLGGYKCGEIASKIATDLVFKYIEEHYENQNINKSLNEIIKDAVKYANKYIYELEKTDEKYKGMGTTLVLVAKNKDILVYTSIGDSRIYSIDSKLEKITQITEDDTYVNALLKTNIINKEQAINHPQKHVLTKAIGVFKDLELEVIDITNKVDGYILMCTDGVTNMLLENEILNIFRKNKEENIVDRIVEKANEKGGNDNITALLIKLN